MKKLKGVVALVIGLACTNASSAPCSGASSFTDVLTTDSFCSNAEWLKNRGVTLGCTATGYCPFDFVTRAQMALFMNRLADAILLPPLTVEESFGAKTITFSLLSNPMCVVTVPDANYPRTFSITGNVRLYSDSGQHDVRVTVVPSEGGVFLPAFGDNRGTIETGKHVQVPVVTSITLGPGPKTFQLAMTRGSSQPDFTVLVGGCALRVNGQSVTGSVPPY